jgi:condensin-2 complex subunit H2
LANFYFCTERVAVIYVLQLATCEDICSNFLLLDPRDAPAVFDFLQGKHSGKQNSVPRQGSSVPSKIQVNVFTTPNARSAGKDRQSAAREVLGGLEL